MGTAGCQGIPSKAPQIPEGLSRLEYIWGSPRFSGIGVYIFILDGLRPFRADNHRIITTVLFQDRGEKRSKPQLTFLVPHVENPVI